MDKDKLIGSFIDQPPYQSPRDGFTPNRDDEAGTVYVNDSGNQVELVEYDKPKRRYLVRIIGDGKEYLSSGYSLTPLQTALDIKARDQRGAELGGLFYSFMRSLIGDDLVSEEEAKVHEDFRPFQAGMSKQSGMMEMNISPELAARILKAAEQA